MGAPFEENGWMRMFVAVVPPEEVLEDLEEFLAPRREATPWGRGSRVVDVALVASYLGEGPRGRPRHQVVERFSLGRAGSG